MPFIIANKKTGYYFSGVHTSKGQQIPQWVFHPKLAKVYVTRVWAEKTAEKWNGIVEVTDRRR